MNEDMKCPECGNELKEGYIFSPRRISWSESGESIYMDYGSETLVKDAWLKVKKIPALRCEACHLVVFKYK
ncbi:hypothetical protein EQV77_13140 [Halobacillus fulvus]|nr:hypothetical protein EQV77_13140 [Halobacillus fulvus]